MSQQHGGPLAGVLIAGVLLSASSPALAQDTREGTIVAAQAEKAKHLAPYTPSRIEALASSALGILTPKPNGWYPYFDSVYAGGGFTLGAGYRHAVGDRGTMNVAGLYSANNYKLVEVAARLPGHVPTRPQLALHAGWRDATEVAYHGLGIDSPEAESTFRMSQAFAIAEVIERPRRWVAFTGGLAFENYAMSGTSGDNPSIEEVHTPATAPGLGASPSYLHVSGAAAIDTRPAAEYARRGLLYQVAYHDYADRDHTYSFDRLDADIVHHLPILRENWVLSLRGRLQTTLHDSDVVPYFLLPALGSGRTLRGYSSWRFRDRQSALFSAEWRWTPSLLALDAALFFDSGTVADHFDGLALRHMRNDAGIGLRFHGPLSTPLRIELAQGREGLRLVFAGSAAF